MLLLIIISTIFVSLISIVGVLVLFKLKEKFINIIEYLMPFAAGTMLSVAFFDLIPESFEMLESSFNFVFLGIVLFFLIERYIHWHHCRIDECKTKHKVKPYAYLNLIGDALHNFLDGIIIAASYLIDLRLGLVTTFAIIAHEIPQELGDASILIHSGMKKNKIIFYNFISATFAFLGVFTHVFFLEQFHITPYLIALAAGGFIYLALADIIPEIGKDNSRKMIIQTILFFVGIILVYFFGVFFAE